MLNRNSLSPPVSTAFLPKQMVGMARGVIAAIILFDISNIVKYKRYDLKGRGEST